MNVEEIKPFWTKVLALIPVAETVPRQVVSQLHDCNTHPKDVENQMVTLFGFFADVPGNVWATSVYTFITEGISQ